MDYLSFDLTVGPRTPAGYPLSAKCLSVGEAPADNRPAIFSPFDPNDAALLDLLVAVRTGQAATEQVRQLGQSLAAALLLGDVGQLFDNARSVAAQQEHHGLRVRLRLPPELTVWPWELLWPEGEAEPLAISTDTVITRYLNLKGRVPRLEALRPLRLLAILPRAAGVNSALHRAALEAALAQANAGLAPGAPPVVSPTWLTDIVTEDAVLDAMNAVQPHLVHFIGHGQFEDGQASLLLTDAGGEPLPALGGAVAGFFRNYDSVRLVVLNACQGAAADSAQALLGLAPSIAAQGVPAVVAMQWDIFDWAAQRFAARFYRGLWSGPEAGEVETALTRARAAIYGQSAGLAVYATPVLLLRADGDRLWTAAQPAAGPASAAEPAHDPASAATPPVSGSGNISIGAGTHIGGSVVAGGMHIGGDYVGGDQIITQHAGGDIVGGDKITITTQADSAQAQFLSEQFRAIQQLVAARPPSAAVDSDELQQQVQSIESEARKGASADPKRLNRLLDELAAAAGDIFTATAAALANPRLGLPEPLRRLAADKQQAHQK